MKLFINERTESMATFEFPISSFDEAVAYLVDSIAADKGKNSTWIADVLGQGRSAITKVNKPKYSRVYSVEELYKLVDAINYIDGIREKKIQKDGDDEEDGLTIEAFIPSAKTLMNLQSKQLEQAFGMNPASENLEEEIDEFVAGLLYGGED